MDSKLQDIDRVEEEETFEKLNSLFQNSHNIHDQNMNTELEDVIHEVHGDDQVEVNTERLGDCHPHLGDCHPHLGDCHPHLGNKDNIYDIFENSDSNFPDKDKVDVILVEALNIKPEIKDHQEHISALEDKNVTKGVKNSLNSEVTDLTSPLRSDLTSITAIEGSSSIIGKVDLEVENNSHTIDNCNLKSKNTDFNIENFDSGFEAMDCENGKTDSQIDPLYSGVDNNKLEIEVDPHPILMIKRLPGNILNKGFQVFPILENDFCQSKEISSSISYQKEVHTCRSSDGSSIVAFSHNTEHPNQCNVCSKEFSTEDILRKHMITHSLVSTERLFWCNACGEDFKTLGERRIHMMNHSPGLPHPCHVCGKRFKTLQELSKHMISHSIGPQGTHACSICNNTFNTLYDLRAHMIIHSAEPTHQCNMCDQKFQGRLELGKHMRSHSPERPHQCNMCNQRFKRIYELRTHMSSHSTERPHQCNVCNVRFKTLRTLRKHIQTHSTERPYQCNMCSRKCKSSQILKVHKLTHSTEKPYRCSTCDKEFKTSQSLKSHVTIHSSEHVTSHYIETTHACSICNKKVVSVYNTRTGMLPDSTERPHVCSTCISDQTN